MDRSQEMMMGRSVGRAMPPARRLGRKKPYTERGISRVPCLRCGKPSRYQWQACSLGNRWIAVCPECDVGLNSAALRYAGVPGWKEIIANYAKSKGVQLIGGDPS